VLKVIERDASDDPAAAAAAAVGGGGGGVSGSPQRLCDTMSHSLPTGGSVYGSVNQIYNSHGNLHADVTSL